MKIVIVEGAGSERRRLASVVWAACRASVAFVATTGADAIRVVLEEEPDVLILGPRLNPKEGLGLLHVVRPLLPVLRVVAVDDRRGCELKRAFLLGDIELLLAGPDWVDVIPEVLRQWKHEERSVIANLRYGSRVPH